MLSIRDLKGWKLSFYCIVLTFVVIKENLLAQTADLPTITPPTPDASALARYGDTEISPYTGLPNISIPLYTIQSRDVALPISISYNASGIKVEEEASSIGLGWNLLAGGSISRSVRGFDDFLNVNNHIGYLNTPSDPSPNPTNQYITNVCNNLYDSEPDIFYFNFAGYSGKFFLERKKTANSPVQVKLLSNKEKFLIKYEGTNDQAVSKWTITVSDGTRFTFNSKEYTQTWPGVGLFRSPVFNEPHPGEILQRKVITSWYLETIKSPTGEEISFEYLSEKAGKKIKSRSVMNLAERSTICLVNGEAPSPSSNCPATAQPFGFIPFKAGFNSSTENYTCLFQNLGKVDPVNQCLSSYGNSISIQVFDNIYISAINFPLGKVVFTWSNREDIEAHYDNLTTYNKPQKLDQIEVQQNLRGTFLGIKKYLFTYEYQEAPGAPNYSGRRLKLKQLQESNGSTSKKPFTFNYYAELSGELVLPAKTSFSKDYWGYFNSADNENVLGSGMPTSIPAINCYQHTGEKAIKNGANREANQEACKAGTLKKITYPTGGHSIFDYELNTFNINQESTNLPTKKFDVKLSGTTNTKIFELTEQTIVSFDATLKCNAITTCYGPAPSTNPCTGYNQGIKYVSIINLETLLPSWERTYSDFQCLFSNCADTETFGCGIKKKTTLSLPKGKYLFKINLQTGFSVEANAKYALPEKVSTYTTNIQASGGGLRVKTITVHDDLSAKNDQITTYKYTWQEPTGLEKSTGKLMSFPKYGYVEYYYYTSAEGDGKLHTYLNVLLQSQASSVIPLGSSAQGNFVGYDRVEEIHGVNGENGRTIYYYKNDAEEMEPFLPNSPSLTHSPSNGILVHKRILDSNFKKISSSYFNYKVISSDKLNGIAMINRGGCTGGSNSNPSRTLYKFYSEPSEWWYLDNKIDSTYDATATGNTTALVSTTTFLYNANHKQEIKSTTKDSEGRSVVTNTYYALDVPTLAEARMHDENNAEYKHMHSYPIKTETIVDNTFAGGVINTYSYDVTNQLIYQTSTDVGLSGSNKLYETRLSFTKYDNKGNIIEMKKNNDISIAIIWGYNQTLPIAKITNATYSEVETAIAASDMTLLKGNSLTPEQVRQKLEVLYSTPSLSKAQIILYAHDPLVGVVSISDENNQTTSYYYDDLKRLSSIMDDDLQYLVRYKYQYK